MKSRKWLAVAGVTLVSAGVLAACSGGSGDNTSNSSVYSFVYTAEPETLDYTTSGKSSTHEVTSNLVDGLMENDSYGNYIPSLAEDWKLSKDGLTYTYTLRKGVMWYTSEGEEYAEVKAQDFVTGLKHAADKKSEQLYLVQDSIVGLDDYVKGNNKDFSSVGVKAVDDYTIQYTLKQPETFWNSKTTMGVLMPVNEDFLKSKGDDFGKPEVSSILANGPFLLKAMTSKSSQEFEKNANYWDKDNVHVDSVKLTYYDGSDPESLIKKFSEGSYSKARVFPNSSTFDSVKEKYEQNIYYGIQSAGTYITGINIDRQSYNYTAKTTEAQKESTKKAILNKDFRQALMFAFDREAFSAQGNGKDGAIKVMRNVFVPPTFVAIGESSFADVVEQDLQSYGEEWKDVNLDDAQDGLYNVEKAKAEFAKAKEALQTEGVEFPIHLDVPVSQEDKNSVSQVQSLKQSIEKNLGQENVVIDIQQLKTEEVHNITYYSASAKETDWDINVNNGWNPDFRDPSTYLDILRTDKVSDSLRLYAGIDPNESPEAVAKVGFTEYNKLIEEASKENSDPATRYTKYAAAQAWLTDSGLVVPWRSGGASPGVSKVVPFSQAFTWAGNKGNPENYKYLKLQDEIVTTKDYQAAREKWEKERVESNAKAQEEFAKHVE